ncbi:MAG TPA: glycyl-radical enzyme activating protein [Bacteroidales bacterium]|jgi:pyruvate formate lyase activating enzyme|nr:glycyl-radical enzyme activating protein [Bacteroidales bacterium]
MLATIFDIKHFAVHDGPGIRQTIFFKGCPLNCWWCHNPESQDVNLEIFIQVNKLDGKEFKRAVTVGYQITSKELMDIILGDQVFFEESNGGVTFSGGEPLMQSKFLQEILVLCKQKSIHTCIDTTGFTSKKTIEMVANLADCFLFDIKIIDNELHQKYTGVPVDGILENLQWLDQNHKNVILRYPVVPGITDTEKNISDIKFFLKSLKNINQIDLLPYHNISKGKYTRFKKENKMKDTKPLSNNDMLYLKSEFESIGFKVGIGG